MTEVRPAQPDKASYPLSDLQLYPHYNREMYFKTFRTSAPPWDPSQRIKRWTATDLDPALGPEDVVQFNYFDQVKQQFGKFTLSVKAAIAINLPGAYDYPKYVVKPTEASSIIGDVSSRLNPASLCERDEADKLAAELGGQVIEQLPTDLTIYWGTETRRTWLIALNGSNYCAAMLLASKSSNGVGAPGHWNTTNPNGPVWLSEVQQTGEWDQRPEVPLPSRVLLPNEAIKSTVFGGETIYRTDKVSEFNTVQTTGGGLTPEQDTILRNIASTCKKVLQLSSGLPA